MLSERLGHVFDRPAGFMARKIPLSPNALTITGFLITLVASYILITDLRLGGLLILAGGVFDILDGVVARTKDKSTIFGAFLDSVLDRYSDAVTLIGIALYYGLQGNYQGLILSLGSLTGSFLISYARARAEGLGMSCRQGLLERPERVILISFGAITDMMMPILWILIILTHVTVFQRIYYAWKTAPRNMV